MDARSASTPPDLDASPAPFRVREPTGGARVPLVFATPHSGRHYPAELTAASRLGDLAIRRSEDAFVDLLIDAAPESGVAVLEATHARAYIDVNREAYELDLDMFVDPPAGAAPTLSPRVAAGLGSVARVVSDGCEIYARKLRWAEAEARIRKVHQPYHAALEALISAREAAFGRCLLVDWHSMPSGAVGGGPVADFVLGDRYGHACPPAVTGAVETALSALGYRVARNVPFAGGFTTETHGRPAAGRSALQIEIRRDLYLDERRIVPNRGFGRLKSHIERLFPVLASIA